MRRPQHAVPSALLSVLLVAASLGGCSDSDDDDGPAAPPGDDPASGDPGLVDPPDDGDPGTSPDPLITVDSRERLVEEAFAIFSEVGWDTTPLSLPSALYGEEGVFAPADSLAEQPLTEGYPLVLTANCTAGSGLLEAQIPSGVGNVSWQARLDACTTDPERTALSSIDGSAGGDWNLGLSARSDDLSWITASGERVTFSGEMRRVFAEPQSDNVAGFATAEARQIVLDDVDGSPRRSIEQATSVRRIGSVSGTVDIASVSGGFTFRTALTGGQAVTVRTPTELAYRWDVRTPAPENVSPESLGEPPLGDVFAGENRNEEQHAAVDRVRRRWAFATGTLEVEAEDGSRLVLDADTGELDTVRVVHDEGRGDGPEESVIDWPDSWYRALAPDMLPSDRAGTAGD